MENISIQIFEDENQLSDFVGNSFLSLIERAGKDEKLSVALSGGSTPEKIYKHIADNFANKIDWNSIKLFFGDERAVPPTDEQSNYKMVEETLLKSINIPRENLFRIRGENNPEDEAKRYCDILKKELPIKDSTPQFDIVLLGIGEDGHTASIFPDQIEKFNSEYFCEYAIHPQSGQNRITITGQVINNAKIVVFIAVGKNKAKIVSDILSKKSENKIYPASLVNPTNGKLFWLLDSEAAEQLDKKADA